MIRKMLVVWLTLGGWGVCLGGGDYAWEFSDNFEGVTGTQPGSPAAWMFSDGFEDVTGTVPPSSDDADPNHSTWNGMNINDDTSDPTLIQVWNDPNNAYAGDKFVHVVKGSPLLERYWGFGGQAPKLLNEDFVLRFAAKVGNNIHGFRFWAGKRYDETTDSLLLQALGVGVQGGVLCFYNSAYGQPYALVPLSTLGFDDVGVDGNWHYYELDVHVFGQTPPTYDIYFDSQLVATGVPVENASVLTDTGMNSIHAQCHPGSLATWAEFEQVSLEPKYPGTSDDADPDPNIWNADRETTDQTVIQVWDDPNNAYGGDQYVHLREDIAGTLHRYWTFDVDAPLLVNKDFSVIFSVRVHNDVHGFKMGMGKQISPGPSNVAIGFGMGIQAGKVCVYMDGKPYGMWTLGELGYQDVQVSGNTWYKFGIEAHVEDGCPFLPTFDLYMDDQLIAADVPWNNYQCACDTGTNALLFMRHGGHLAAGFDVDNVRLLAGPLPLQCGDPGTLTLSADLDENCYVNWGDFGVFASQWLECTDPENPSCTGP